MEVVWGIRCIPVALPPSVFGSFQCQYCALVLNSYQLLLQHSKEEVDSPNHWASETGEQHILSFETLVPHAVMMMMMVMIMMML